MEKIKVAVNGFGRIGRYVTKLLLEEQNVQLIAINDLADTHTMAHLLQYDSVHRVYEKQVEATSDALVIDDQMIYTYSCENSEDLPWRSLAVDLVIECTGKFRTAELASAHITAGAKKVILSAPPLDQSTKTIVVGINDDTITGEEDIISNASCTTNCAAPMVKIINDLCGIESAYITTIHSYTTDQKLHDSPHKDLRRARAAALSIVPTTTGAAKAITRIFPAMEGKMGGCGIRVPVPDGSLTDITFIVKEPKSLELVNDAFFNASQEEMKSTLQFIDVPLVSTDIIGNKYSCIFDSQLTSVIGKMVKIVGWYDNEAGYSNRLVDLIRIVSEKGLRS